MPNTVPQATTQELLEEKFKIASKTSYVIIIHLCLAEQMII